MTHSRRPFAGLAAAIAAPLTLVVIAAAQGTAGAALAAAATGATGPTGTGGPLTASLTACHTDPVAANRYAIFASQMDTVPGAVMMSVSFQLEERSGAGSAFAPVAAPGFDTWVTSQRGVGIFTYSHEVTGLPAPAAFRVLVRARWIARRRHILRVDQHLSPACVQTLLQPDLALGTITRPRTATPAGGQWSVEVRNNGAAAAGPFQVSLAIGTAPPVSTTVSGLGPATSEVVTLAAPACTAGQKVTVTADSAKAITEPPDARRSRTVSCIA